MECCGQIKESRLDKDFETKVKLVIGLIILAIGVYIVAYSGNHGQGLGYLLIMGAPFLMLPEEKPNR